MRYLNNLFRNDEDVYFIHIIENSSGPHEKIHSSTLIVYIIEINYKYHIELIYFKDYICHTSFRYTVLD